MNFISILTYLIVGLAVGVGLIGMSLEVNYLNIDNYMSALNTMIAGNFLARVIVFLFGCLLILIFLRFIQRAFMRYSREKTIKAETENGYVSITLSAIEDMIKKSLSEEQIISYIKPRILSTRKEVISYVKVALRETVNIKSFAENIQAKLKDKLQSLLGNDKTLKINVEVKKIAFPKKDVKENEEEESEEGPLRKY